MGGGVYLRKRSKGSIAGVLTGGYIEEGKLLSLQNPKRLATQKCQVLMKPKARIKAKN